MSKIRHTLQLLHSGNLSTRQIGAALGNSKSTVSEIASYTRAAALNWEQAQQLSDEELQARLGGQHHCHTGIHRRRAAPAGA